MAGGIAHDFNNMLAVINGYTELLMLSIPDGPHHAKLAEIRKAGERAAGLTRQLLAFGRRQLIAPRPMDLRDALLDSEEPLRRLLGDDIELVTLLADDVWEICADASQVEQVLLNLAANSRDAMPEGGRFVVEAANEPVVAPRPLRTGTMPAGEYAVLTVSDGGAGMDEDTLTRAFEPFFTTRERGKGLGLGLATVYGIVTQTGAFMDVCSRQASADRPGATVFRIYFPRHAGDPEHLRPQPAASAGPASETVLVVEDEEMVRSMVATVLGAKGYRVLEAMSVNEAVAALKEHPEPVHLVLTDVVMPGRSGRELARIVEAEYQHSRILYMSGYTDDAVVRWGVSSASAHFIQKPFSPDALALKVREVLASPPLA